MLRQNTLFVLGAGASHPYDFPVGSTLSDNICSSETLKLECGRFSKADIEAFTRAFANSGLPSIDAYLERHGKFDEIGKLAIAYHICKHEDPAAPFQFRTRENWYKALWGEITQGAGDNWRNACVRLAFITFNYDRSLEHFLFTAAMNTFGEMNEERAYEFLGAIPIVHVYGQLGMFHYRPDVQGARQYRVEFDPQQLSRAASGIHLIRDGSGSPQLNEAQELFQWAELVCFLGFGFNSTNVARLNLNGAFRWLEQAHRPLPRVIASVMSKTKKQKDMILADLLPTRQQLVQLYDADCITTLAEDGIIR